MKRNEPTGSNYLDAKIAELVADGANVRVVETPELSRPIAVCGEYIYIGGDAPVCLDCGTVEARKAALKSVRRMLMAEIHDGYGSDRAQQIWARLEKYEARW